MKVCQENSIYMALKYNPQTTESTMEIVVLFLVLSFGLSALAGGEKKSKYCVLFIHLIQVVCVVVGIFLCLWLFFVVFFRFPNGDY